MMNPKIRFKKSDGSDYQDYDKCVLSDCCTITKGKQVDKNTISDTGKYYHLNGGIEPSNYVTVYNTEANTISISEGGNSCGFVKWNEERFFSGGHNYTLQDIKDTIEDKYLYQFLKNHEEQLMALRVGGGLPNIQKKDISEFEVVYPLSSDEQKKLVSFMSEIDNLIASAENEVESTKRLKKAMLQKMFPKNGEKVPEIRFPEFTDAWEQRKFGDEFKLSQGLQVPVEEQLAEQLENTEQFIRIIDVTQEGESPRYVYNPTGKGRVKTDDIFFVRYGSVGTIGYGYNGVIANNLFKAEPLFKACNMFLFQQFSGTDFNKKLIEMSASTSMPAVNFGALNNLTFWIPSYEEQNKIGEYFGQLDNLITLHQRKLDAYKKFKKAMMQKMFV